MLMAGESRPYLLYPETELSGPVEPSAPLPQSVPRLLCVKCIVPRTVCVKTALRQGKHGWLIETSGSYENCDGCDWSWESRVGNVHTGHP